MELLSPNFSLAELTISDKGARMGLSNVPSDSIKENLKVLAQTLEKIRSLVGGPISVTSGYRSPLVNAAVGGEKLSAHTLGLAADIHCNKCSPAVLAKLIKESGIKFDQLILEYDTWVHIGLAKGSMRNQVLTKKTGQPYTLGLS